MNYPRIYERVYCEPVAITRERWLSIHSVLLPRLADAGVSTFILPDPNAAGPAKTIMGKRKQRAFPSVDEYGRVTDARLYHMAAEGVAVVPVYGVLAKNLSSFEEACGGGTDIGPIAAALDQALHADDVKQIILDIDSPGGAVTGIPELAGLVSSAAARKPVYAFTEAGCCSAAYWIASQASEVWATPSAVVGSIGVYLAWLDETVALQLQGLKLEYFGAGEHKAMGLPGKPLTQAQRDMLQAKVDKTYAWFTGAVTSKRPDVTSETMQGQTFNGEEAQARGLVDGLVTGFDEFVRALAI